MNAEDGKSNAKNEGAPFKSEGEGSRKPYGPPRLRSLGQVNVITGATPSTELSKRKPQG